MAWKCFQARGGVQDGKSCREAHGVAESGAGRDEDFTTAGDPILLEIAPVLLPFRRGFNRVTKSTAAMTGAALPGFAAVVGLLLLAGVAAVAARRLVAQVVPVLCGIGALLALAYLAAGAPAQNLFVPIGLPGIASVLALDGLSGFFLLLVMLTGTAASVAAIDEKAATSPFLPVFIGGMTLTLLAGDAFTLVAGFEVMSLASLRDGGGRQPRPPACSISAWRYSARCA